MNKLLLSSVALLGLTASAFAADLPVRTMAPAAPVFAPVPVFTWSGFYFGVNAGYGFADHEDNNSVFVPAGTFPGPLATTSGTLTFADGRGGDRDGFVGGGQIGYNLQFGSFVIGLEADIQYADLGGDGDRDGFNDVTFSVATGPVPPAALFPNVARHRGGGVEWFGTVRGRLGFAFDRVLIYGTGGFAYGEGDDGGNGFANGFRDNDDDIRTGYAVGGGVEFALPTGLSLFGSSAVTFKIEGLYVNLDRDRNNGVVFDAANNVLLVDGNGRGGDEFAVVRAGLNFKF